jgi:hypothetical protein
MRSFAITACIFFLLVFNTAYVGFAQQKASPTYVDAKGVFRWTKDKKPVYLFGVNYTLPFAYGYRSVKALNLNIEKEIDKDVYHMARMGVDAFRVHVWDTEISDSLGNLKENEHLRLFDYLLSKLEERNIKIIITPIAFWGNGYPEKDERTGSFSSKYGKDGALVNEDAFKAQERYLKQLFSHINPYTKKNYSADDFIIATEINNEPHPSGPKERVTRYINTMKAAINSTGWNKPVFYNISESPWYADAVAKSEVNGFSFQWYPIGLVAGHEQKGNLLPNVDKYTFPFDTIPQFKNKARMVYEFDAADTYQSYLYPAVARSFKQAGFQWVTQFAYDPLATAYGNTEYQTHYLNLAYTPAKAISFLIANRVFHLLPANKNYGGYPADSVFDAYHVSYKQNMSEMNTAAEYYYSGSTNTQPSNVKKLMHIAGVGSSPLVKYKGYGAYFLDKMDNGTWRLEVMPDAIVVRDPFERPSPSREAVHIAWNAQPMQISLPDLGAGFDVKGVNTGNAYTASAQNGRFIISPGTYVITRKGNKATLVNYKNSGNIGLTEFAAPQPLTQEPYLTHTPPVEVSAGKSISINAKIINADTTYKLTLNVIRDFGAPLVIPMTRLTPYDYSADIPANQVTTGRLQYRIVVQSAAGAVAAFPGNHKGDPQQWDYLNTDYWQTFIAAANGGLSLFDPAADQKMFNPYMPTFSRRGGLQLVSGQQTGSLTARLSAANLTQGQVIGMQLYLGDKIKARMADMPSFKKLVIRARVPEGQAADLRIALIQTNASAYAAKAELNNEWKTIEMPLSDLKPDSCLLLPRPYPGFLPLWFKASTFSTFNISMLDKLELTAAPANNKTGPIAVEIESVMLRP